MVRVAVVGGTGMVGGYVVAAARRRGHDPLVLSRSTGVDVHTGQGLAAGLVGADAVVDVSHNRALRTSASQEWFQRSAEHLLGACRRAGVRHLVVASIVGIENLAIGYYAGKLRQEEVLLASGAPVTVVRATQLHALVADAAASMRRRGLAVVPKVRLQPVSGREVGEMLLNTALLNPQGRARDFAGPQVETAVGLARAWYAAEGRRTRVVSPRIPSSRGRALQEGALLPAPGARLAQVSFQEWLRRRDDPERW